LEVVMGKPYSLDLRERVCAYVAAGNSCRSAARIFGISPSSAVRFAAFQRDRGDVAPKPQGRPAGRFGKLAPYKDFLIEIVRAEPDITLSELSSALEGTYGLTVQLSSIHRALARAGFSYKKRSHREGT
jgi:transposase